MRRYQHLQKIAAVFLALVLIISMIPSSGQRMVKAAEKATITVGAVNTGKLTIPAKTKYKLEAKASTGKLRYKSSKPKVAKVNKKGLVRGLKPGKTVITIKGKGVSKKIKVTVVKKKKYKKVKKIAVKDAPSSMTAGESATLKATFTPAKASNKNLKFKSSDITVAQVNSMGVIEAMAAGTAVITVTSCANKKAKAEVTIEVLDNANWTVTFDSLGGTQVPAQTVLNGKKAEEPDQPSLENAQFAGWYLEDAEEPFKFTTPITEDINLYAHWNVENVSDDGKVDAGDLALLESAGKIQLMTDGDSSTPRAIIGTFTEDKVKNEGDAKDVLESMKSLFNRAIDQDGNPVEVDFKVKESDITSEKVSTPADDKGFKAPDVVYYRYSPTMPDGTGVEGGDIIISTDTDGNVTGLNATYNPAVFTLHRDPDPEIDWEMIRLRAINYVLNQIGQATIGTYGYGNIYSSLDCSGKLVVSTGLEVNTSSDGTTAEETESKTVTTDPFYAFKVRVTNSSLWEEQPDYSDPETDMTGAAPSVPSSAVEPEGKADGDYINEINSIPAIDWTVYIDPDDYETVYSAYDNISFASWQNTTLSLRRSTGDYHDTDLRFLSNGNGNSNLYEFYNPSRKISIFQVCSRTYENGSYVYGAVDRKKTTAFIITCTSSQVSTYYPTANTLLANAETVYDFYGNSLDWKSYNGDKANLYIGFYDDPADFPGNSANACWWGDLKKITFTRPVDGVDYSRCLDVMGHEFTHGVIDYKVGKVGDKGFKREGQAGSLDEAYADIMGQIIQKNAGEGSANDWEIGENRRTDGTNNSLRSLSNPSGRFHSYFSGTNDPDSIYNDSTIFSHAFYLMATDSRIKNQISWKTWGQLFFRSLSRLSRDSKFIDARYAVLSEAAEMKFTGAQQYVINEAFDEVGITDPKKVSLTLTWGKSPSDLDLYLIGPFKSTYYKINYNNKILNECVYKNSKLQKRTLLASLDQDCRTANGTEVIKIHKLTKGTYYCIVRYGGGNNSLTSTVLAKSNAHVVAKCGDEEKDYYVHSDSQGTCWLACMVKVDDYGNASFWRRTNYYSDGSGSLYRYGNDTLFTDVYNKY